MNIITRMTTMVITGLTLTSCAGSQSITAEGPIGISKSINGLQRSVCNCGGVENEEAHEIREKRKKEAAETGVPNTDIVQDEM